MYKYGGNGIWWQHITVKCYFYVNATKEGKNKFWGLGCPKRVNIFTGAGFFYWTKPNNLTSILKIHTHLTLHNVPIKSYSKIAFELISPGKVHFYAEVPVILRLLISINTTLCLVRYIWPNFPFSPHTKRLRTKRLLDKTSPYKTSPYQNVSCNKTSPEQNVSVTKRLRINNIRIWENLHH
jgi:hypothetical protein